MGMLTRRCRLLLTIGFAVCGVAAAAAQYPWGEPRMSDESAGMEGNTPYDGRSVLVRVRYRDEFGRFQMGRGRAAGWSHDYPRGELHFTKILKEVSLLTPRMDGSNILSLDDPELFNFPVAYMSEPGAWVPS